MQNNGFTGHFAAQGQQPSLLHRQAPERMIDSLMQQRQPAIGGAVGGQAGMNNQAWLMQQQMAGGQLYQNGLNDMSMQVLSNQNSEMTGLSMNQSQSAAQGNQIQRIHNRSYQQRREQARAFLNNLTQLPNNEYIKQYGTLLDTEKLLQILTNASFVERKSQQVGRKDSSDLENDLRTVLGGEEEEDGEAREPEDNKIINKKRKRTEKVEEVHLDLGEFFNRRKRFRPELGEQPIGAREFEENRMSILKRVLSNFFCELQSYTSSQEQIITFLKSIVKNIHYSHFTESSAQRNNSEVSFVANQLNEERYLIEWVQENEPQTLLEVCQFWMASAFAAASEFEEQRFFSAQTQLIVNALEDSLSLLFHSDAYFEKWLSVFKRAPALQKEAILHLGNVMAKVEEQKLEQYYKKFVQVMILDFGLTTSLQKQIFKVLLEGLFKEERPSKFQTICHLLFSSSNGLYHRFSPQIQAAFPELITAHFKEKKVPVSQEAYWKNVISLYGMHLLLSESTFEQLLEYLGSYQGFDLASHQTTLAAKVQEIIQKKGYTCQEVQPCQKIFDLFKTAPGKFQGLVLPVVESLVQGEVQGEFVEMCKALAKGAGLVQALIPVLEKLEFEDLKEAMVNLVFKCPGQLDVKRVMERAMEMLKESEEKSQDMIYNILKQKISVAASKELSKEDIVKRILDVSECVSCRCELSLLVKLVERLIKNEKWGCNVLMMLILKVHRHSGKSPDPKEVSLSMVKKVLKARVWEIKARGREEEDQWECIRMGLMLFFTQSPSKEKYKMFKEYLDSKVKREMMEQNAEFERVYNQFSRG